MIEPQRPRPEDFGLSEERIRLLRTGPRLRLFGISTSVVLIAAFAVSSSMTSSLSLAIVGGLCFMIFPGMLIAGLLAAPLEWRWRESQPDKDAWNRFGLATLEYEKAHLDWLKRQQSWWASLAPSRFEVEVAENLRARGFQVVRTGRTGDGGVDLKATAPNGKRIVVQCKAYRGTVGPAAVRELYGTLLHDGAHEGWLVALVGFSSAAKQFADGMDLPRFRRHLG